MKAVNLIPSDQRRGAGGIAGRSGGIVYVVVGGLAVVVALGVLYAFAVKTVADRTGELAGVTQQANAVSAQAASLQPYVQVEQLRERAVGGVVSLAEARFDWPDAMQQLALALPNDVTLTSLNGTVAGPAVTSAAAPVTATAVGAGASFAMAGCASSQAEVATVLRQLAQVPGVSGVSLQSATKQGKAANAGKPVARRKAEASGAGCPLVTFSLTLTYASTYTLPKQKLPAAGRGGSKAAPPKPPGGGTVQATTRRPAR